MNDDPTRWNQADPTKPAAPFVNPYPNPYEPHTDSPTGREPDYVHDYMSIPPPPPPFTAGRKHSYLPLWIGLVISILLAGSVGLYALTRYIPASKSQPTPTVHVVSSTTSASTSVSASPSAAVDPEYTAPEILQDFINAGCPCGYGVSYGTTIWDYTDQSDFINVHATSSAVWEDPPQSANGTYVGVWVYTNAATASSAYTQLGNDSNANLPHYEWPSEYLHGRCLLLIREFGNGGVAWSGYQRVVNQYCV